MKISPLLGFAYMRPSFLLALLLLQGIETASSASDYYIYTGEGNNEVNPQWGASAVHYLRTQMDSGYEDDAGSMNDDSSVPSPRLVSSTLTLPSHKSRERSSRQYTDLLVFFGQLLKHDIVLTQTASTEQAAITVPFCDFYHDKETCGLDEVALDAATPKTIPFTRSAFELDANGQRQQVNLATAFIDGGGIYGHDSNTASKLRTYSKGKLLTFNDELPLNTLGVSLEDPVGIESAFSLRVAGDSRANSHPIALALHSLFVREHNRVAGGFHAADSHLTDEELYQKSRKWVVALLQKICFYEFLPTLGIDLPPYTAYKTAVNPGIDAFFATTALRFGHSSMYDVVLRVDDEGREIPAGHLLLHESFYQPTSAFSAGIEPLLRGASFARQAEVTPIFSNSLKNFLYGAPKHGGQDLLALNIQRGRDHGIPLYSSARNQLNLDTKTSFHQVTSDYFLAKDLEAIYETVDKMDAYVGGLAEEPYMNSSLGELLYTSIQEQFTRLRDGDRFYFEHLGNGLFTEEEIKIIKNTTLRDIILRNTDIQALPENIFIRNNSSPWSMSAMEAPAASEMSPSPGTSVEIGDDFLSEKASMELAPSVYTLEWQLEVINTVEYMRFTIICATTGWVGLGFPKDENSAMVEADIIIGKVETGVSSVDDYWAASFSQPVTDTSLGDSRDVELISGMEVDGMTTIVFRRKLIATDDHDRAISKTSPTPLIFAWHSTSDDLLYHSVTNRGRTVIDLYGMLPLMTSEPVAASVKGFQETGFGGHVPVDSISDLSFAWNIVNKSDHKWLNATIRMKTNGLSFVAIGMQEESGDLTGSDIIKVESSGKYCDLHDSWAVDGETIKYDYMLGGNNDLDHVYCRTKDGYVEAGFMRLINTGDVADLAILENGNSNVVFLWDRSEIEFNSQTLQSKCFKVDFFSLEGSRAWEVAKDLSSSTPPDTSPAIEGPEGGAAPSGRITLDEENEYTISYSIHGPDIDVELSLKGTGFVGVGIPGADRNMHSADVIVAANDGQGGCQVDDYWSETFAKPAKDVDIGGVDNLRNKTCSIENGYIKAGFVRSFIQEDEYDRSFLSNASSATIIYAFHTSSDGLTYHGATSRGVVDIRLTPEGTDSQELLLEEFDDNSKKDLAEGYTVWWKIVEGESGSINRKKSRKLMQENELQDDAEVIIKLQRMSIGWMGFGIDPADASVNGMQDTDMYVGWISTDSTVTIMDAWSVGFMMPESDGGQGGENSILAYAGEEKDGVSTIVFKRKVNTGDPFDRVIKGSRQDVVFAFGDSDGLPAGGHGPCCRGKTTLNWDTRAGAVPPPKGPAVPNENLKSAHAWFMVLGWAIFAILGTMVSHMGRHWKYWIKAHVALELTAVVLSSLGEIIALSYTEGKIRGAHGALFFILLFTMIPQLFVGFFTVKTDETYMKKIHRGLGYFIIGTACWQMWLGMKLFNMDTRFVQCFYAWLISVGVAFNFAAEGTTAHDFKLQLEKKGIEVEQTGSKKSKRSSKSRGSDDEDGGELKKSESKKTLSSESKEEGSFSIKSGRALSKSEQAQKSQNKSKEEKKPSEGISAELFMDSCSAGKQWTVINQKVYDMTQMVEKHPGGPDQILDIIGKDGSELYNTHHGSSESAHRMLAKTLIGDLIDENSN